MHERNNAEKLIMKINTQKTLLAFIVFLVSAPCAYLLLTITLAPRSVDISESYDSLQTMLFAVAVNFDDENIAYEEDIKIVSFKELGSFVAANDGYSFYIPEIRKKYVVEKVKSLEPEPGWRSELKILSDDGGSQTTQFTCIAGGDEITLEYAATQNKITPRNFIYASLGSKMMKTFMAAIISTAITLIFWLTTGYKMDNQL